MLTAKVIQMNKVIQVNKIEMYYPPSLPTYPHLIPQNYHWPQFGHTLM